VVTVEPNHLFIGRHDSVPTFSAEIVDNKHLLFQVIEFGLRDQVRPTATLPHKGGGKSLQALKEPRLPGSLR
jgi:hypothetical protein